MKKTLYLIRHALPDFPQGERRCLGRRTDIGIAKEGKARSELLGEALEDVMAKAGKIYTSPLKRAYETASVIAKQKYRVIIEENLIEMDAGEWDGLSFKEIKERYPDLYVRRTEDMSISPPNGEEYEDTAKRAYDCIHKLVCESESDTIVIVAHSGINRAFLCLLTGTPYKYNRRLSQEYNSVNIIEYDTETDEFTIKEIGREM